MQQTPKANQLHIGLFGKRNVGKSTLMNGLLRQEMSIVSPVAGTTTDIVHKSIEFHPIGPIVFVDTPGIDDCGELGTLRVQKTQQALKEMDLCLWIHNGTLDEEEEKFIQILNEKRIPYLLVYNRKGQQDEAECSLKGITINAKTKEGLEELREAIAKALHQVEEKLCVGDLVNKGDVILLIAPQDSQAPKGRLILPQVQVIRELLDKQAIAITTTTDTLKETLDSLRITPKLAITDSQVFKEVYRVLPDEIPLTSFSILMARQKGDLKAYVEGIEVIEKLQEGDRILIAESCTHNPLHEDIAREKIPRALIKKCGIQLQFEWVTGRSFPEDLSQYKLVIQCGGCMHTPKQIQTRIQQATEQQVPITNFGIVLAYLSEILDNIWKVN